MRFFLAVVCAAALVSAHAFPKRNNWGQPPECAVKCAEKEGNPDPCDPNDVPCICLNIDYGQKVAKCVEDDCSKDDIEKATEYGKKICKDAGVNLEDPVP
ncbi:hypothetical protein FRC00_009036, partial [Tulasnella sp. 408]